MSTDNTTHRVKTGETGKILYATLKETDPDTGTLAPYAIPNGSVVTLLMSQNGGAYKVNSACTILNQTANPGRVSRQWQAADINTPGIYDIEFKVTLPDTTVRKFPCEPDNSAGTVIVEAAL